MKQLKNIKRITGWIASVAALFTLAVTGCSRSELGGGEGTLSFDFRQNDEVTVKGGALRNDVGYALDIVDEKGDTVAHYDDHRNVLAIKLKAGVYTIHAEDNSEWPEDSKFGEPRFGGTQSVTVEAGRNIPVLMTCKLINVKVQVTEFSNEVRDNFTNYSLVIKPTEDYAGRDTLTFTQVEADAAQEGWINQTRKGKFVLIFRAFNKQKPDKCLTYVRTIADALPADFYRFAVKVDSVGNPSDGGALFRLSVKTDLKEYEFPLYVKDQTKPIPVVSRADGISIREPLTTNVVTRDGVPVLDITAEAGIRRIRIRHQDPNVLLQYGLPAMITLGGVGDEYDFAADEAQRAAVARLVTWSEGSVVGRPDFRIDFSGLMNTAALTPGGELLPEGNYEVEVEVYDYDNQLVSQVVTLSVARDFSTGTVLKDQLINGFPGVGAKYAYVSAKWMGAAQPEGLGFEYRILGEGDDAWRTVLATPADIDVAQKSFRALLNGLTPKTLYEFRPVGTGLVPGSSTTFMTDAQGNVPNLDFESGYTIASISSGFMGGSSKNVWSPNLPNESFWSTGNPGSTFEVIGQGLKTNVTTQAPAAEALYGRGNALRMQTYNVDVMSVTSLASGTIFSGAFGYITEAPTSPAAQTALVHYGQPYTGRPLALKGWYKYTSREINRDYGGKHKDLVNTGIQDKCRVYVSLENWGTATSRPDEKNREVVGFGEFLGNSTGLDATTNNYFPFEFKIVYTKSIKPTHIVMGVSSSYLSDDFCGGEGSVLYVDEFELVWDPMQVPAN